MPNITNLILRILNTDSEEWKTARVSYTVNFSSLEVLAGVVFKADARIRPDDFDPNISLPVETSYIRARSEPVPIINQRIFRKLQLDEDRDLRTVFNDGDINVEIRNIPDEWFARVTLSPITFESSVADSTIVRGSWGLGSDL